MEGITLLNLEKVSLSKELFTSEAIISAASNYTNQYYVNIQSNNDTFEVSITPKNGSEADGEAIKGYYNDLIDEQVRHNLELKFGKLREMIVEEAFRPLAVK